MTKKVAHMWGRVAHLASFPRRNRHICTPRWLAVTSYAELLSACQPSILWLHEPESLPANIDLLFPELATEEILEHHSRKEPPPAGIGLAHLPNALVSGHSLVGTRAHLYLMAPITPLFVDQFLPGSHLVGDRKLSRKAKRFLPGASVLLTNWNSHTYGHWLLEGMPKLLLLSRIRDRLPPLRVVLPKSLPLWVTKWIEILMPDITIETYDDAAEYVQCEALLMPTLLLSPEHFPHPKLANLLEDLRPLADVPTRSYKRLFVARGAMNPFRELINQTEIEQIAQDFGLTVIKPENLSIPEQVAQFAQAELLAGEFGSAMHNTLFSPSGSKVFCLNWLNPLQSYIGRLKRHHVGYLLPSNGVPATYALGQRQVRYRIDPKVFRQCLKSLSV